MWPHELIDLGTIQLAAGNRAGALAAFEEAVAIRRELSVAAPEDGDLIRGVAGGLSNIADTLLAAGDTAGASAAYEESLKIFRRLAVANPRHVGVQSDFALILTNIGDMRLAAGDRVGALAVFEEFLRWCAGSPWLIQAIRSCSTLWF